MRDYDGKTAAERIAERRERLIDAGVELFGERGYAATSIRSVLQQSGLRDRYFGESFADLDSLLAAVYSRLIDEETRRLRRRDRQDQRRIGGRPRDDRHDHAFIREKSR